MSVFRSPSGARLRRGDRSFAHELCARRRLTEAIRRHITSGLATQLPYGVWKVRADNAAMVAFVRQRLAPYLSALRTLVVSSRPL